MKKILFISFILLTIVPSICWGQCTCGKINESLIKPVHHNAKMGINPEIISPTPTPIKGLPPSPKIIFEQHKLLFVIDGIPIQDTDSLTITASDIAKISILKDAQVGYNSKPIVLITTRAFADTYEATVFDAGFESFVATQKSENFYSEETLKTKNIFLVNEWNSRCSQPLAYNPEIYEAKIDYDSTINYGKHIEYTLYMFFKFMEAKHEINFNQFTKL